jgi:hypothetical protein
LKPGDLFEITLVQMKGGSARAPTCEEIDRLRAVKKRYGTKAIVLFSWRKGLLTDATPKNEPRMSGSPILADDGTVIGVLSIGSESINEGGASRDSM